MNLNSKKTIVHKDQKTCFEFLSQPENYEKIMPESTEKFELNDQGGFLFKLKGMPEIPLKLNEKTPDSTVVWGSGNKNFKFTLTIDIAKISEQDAEIQFLFNGDFNPMMAMMVKKPLQKFIDTLSENLKVL